MHTATRLALPVIDRVPRAEPRRASLRLRPLRAAQRRHPARARRADGARTGVRGRSGRRWPMVRLKSGRHQPRGSPGRSAAARQVHHARSLRSAAADAVRVAAGRRRAPQGRRLHRSDARLQASLPALSDRSRLRRALPRRADATSSWPTSARRSPAGAQHITFGDPDFFNGPTHALRDRRRAGARVPRRHLRRHDQGRAPASSTRRCCRGCATPGAPS